MCCQFSAPGDAAPWVPFYVSPDFTNDPFTRTLSGNASGHAEAHHSSSVKRFGTRGEMPTGPPTPWLKCVVSDHSLYVKCCCCGLVIHGSWCLSKKATLVQAFYDEKPGSNSSFKRAKWLSLQIPSWYIHTSLAQFPQSVYDMGKSGPA